MTFTLSRLTTALAAAAIALTSLTAAPASAMTREERNALGLILGIGAVAVLADGQKDRRRSYAPEPVRPPVRVEHRERRYDDRRYDYRHGDYRHGDYRHGDYRHGDYRHGDYRRADTCTVRIDRDRHGRRVEVYSPGCRESRGDRSYRR